MSGNPNDRAFDDNASAWLVDAPADTPAAPLDRDLDVDVAIVGGGFTGVSCAYHFSRRFPDQRIALLEAKQLANGASGRNGGLVLNGISFGGDPETVVAEHALTRETVDGIEAMIREHALRVRFRRDGCYHLATTPASAEAQQRELAQLGAHVPWRLVDNDKLPMRGAAGAVLDPTEGLVNGVDLIRALRPVLVAQGVQIFEHTQVTRIREGAVIELSTVVDRQTGSVESTSTGAARAVVTKTRGVDNVVRAKALVLATSGYTPRLGYFRHGVIPVISHVIATDPLPPALLAEIGADRVAGFFDDLPRLAYCGFSPDGRVLFGGGATAAYAYRFGGATTYGARLGDAGERAARAVLLRYLPQLADIPITMRWSGPLDLTLERYVAMGVLGDNIYYSLGYSGHGITLANLSGRVLADLYAGEHDRWRRDAVYMQRPSGIPPEPFRWIGYQLISRITGRSPYKRL